MPSPGLTIGILAAQTGCNVATIRYYEEIGLLPNAQRAQNGHRYYSDGDLKRLTFIKRCRNFGFPIEQVRDLVHLFEDGDRSCTEVRDMAQLHLNTVRVKMEELRQLEQGLQSFVTSCDATCSSGVTRNCTIIEDLSTGQRADDSVSASSCCDTPSKKKSSTRTVFSEKVRPR